MSPAALFTVSTPSATAHSASLPADETNFDMSFPSTSTFEAGAPSHSARPVPSNNTMASDGGETIPSVVEFPGATTGGFGSQRSVISGAIFMDLPTGFSWAFESSATLQHTAVITNLLILYSSFI